MREGRLDHATWNVERADDIGWKFHFEWVGRGGKQRKVAAAREGMALADINRLKGSVDAAQSLSLRKVKALLDAPNKSLQATMRQVQKLSSQAQDAGNLIQQARSVPAQLANTVLSVAKNMLAVANQFTDKMSRTPPETNSMRSNVADVARSNAYLWRHSDALSKVAVDSQAVRDQVQTPVSTRGAQQARTIMGVHIVRPGDTLASISLRWYGNPDNGDSIARANRLPWSAVGLETLGRRTLIVPVLAGTTGR